MTNVFSLACSLRAVHLSFTLILLITNKTRTCLVIESRYRTVIDTIGVLYSILNFNMITSNIIVAFMFKLIVHGWRAHENYFDYDVIELITLMSYIDCEIQSIETSQWAVFIKRELMQLMQFSLNLSAKKTFSFNPCLHKVEFKRLRSSVQSSHKNNFQLSYQYKKNKTALPKIGALTRLYSVTELNWASHNTKNNKIGMRLERRRQKNR